MGGSRARPHHSVGGTKPAEPTSTTRGRTESAWKTISTEGTGSDCSSYDSDSLQGAAEGVDARDGCRGVDAAERVPAARDAVPVVHRVPSVHPARPRRPGEHRRDAPSEELRRNRVRSNIAPRARRRRGQRRNHAPGFASASLPGVTTRDTQSDDTTLVHRRTPPAGVPRTPVTRNSHESRQPMTSSRHTKASLSARMGPTSAHSGRGCRTTH